MSTEARIALWVLVLLPVVFNAVMLWPELLSGAPTKNDSAFHWLMISSASDALAQGRNPFDFWIPQLDLGYPQFLYYQNLPHLVIVAINRLSFGTIGLETLYNTSRYLLLIAFPLTVYWSMRRMEFSAAASAMGAAVSSLLSSDARYGFEFNSYIWRGLGVYTQLWGMHLFFVSLALLHSAIKRGRGYWPAMVSLAALALSHLLFAYIMGIASLIVLIALSTRRTWFSNGVRLAVIGVVAVSVASYMLIPFAQTSLKYMSTLPGLKFGAHRPVSALQWTLTGEVLDHGRLPVLTLLTFAGVIVALVRYKRDANAANRMAVGGLLAWLVLYIGHPTVGPLAKIFPAHDGFVTARFVGAVEVFAIMTMGVFGEWLWQLISRIGSRAPANGRTPVRNVTGPLLAVATVLVLLMPALIERGRYYAENGTWIRETRAALTANTDLAALLRAVRREPGARLYAGQRNNWGGSMMVGPSIKVSDVVKYNHIADVGPPYQALTLNGAFLWNFREEEPAAYDLFDVRFVLTPAAATVPAFYQPYLRNTSYALYRVPTSGPVAFAGIDARLATSSQQELFRGNSAWYVSAGLAAHRFTRWDYMSAAGAFTPVALCTSGSVATDSIAPEFVRAVVNCASPSAVVFKMTYHPNWHVTIDGARTPTYMLSPSFLGVDVPAGRHVVTATYEGTPGKMPLLVFGVLVLIASGMLRRRIESFTEGLSGGTESARA